MKVRKMNLADANQTFDNLMNTRFDNNAGQEYINLRETRKAIDKAYRQMIDRVNASVLLNGETSYADFANKLNERIDYFKDTDVHFLLALVKKPLIYKCVLKGVIFQVLQRERYFDFDLFCLA